MTVANKILYASYMLKGDEAAARGHHVRAIDCYARAFAIKDK